MLKGKYRITTAGKVILFQIVLFFSGTYIGLMWKTYDSNKLWDKLLYSGIEVKGNHLRIRSIKEDETLIKAQYINPLLKKTLTIMVNDKIYTIECSKLIKSYTIESSFKKTADVEKKYNLNEKIKFLQQGASQMYDVSLNYDEDFIKNTIEKIENECNVKPVNASVGEIDHESLRIIPSINGYKLLGGKLEEEIKESLNNNKENDVIISAPGEVYKPAVTTDELSSINYKISSFVTGFSASSSQRTNNIELAAKKINDTLLMPGEIFSFNECVGERREDRGFMIAPVIVNNKIESGIGGGICQVSSTLYNAMLSAGIKALERTAHSLPSSYVKLGLDATVDWNNIDLKFENTLGYPIYIQAYTEDKKIYVNFYSNSSLLEKKYVISTNVYETTKLGTKQAESANVSQGKNSSTKQSNNSYKVRVKRDVYENNKLISSEIISDDEYPREK